MDTGTWNNLLGFLIIGVLFYFVIRKVRMGGCCGHSQGEDNQHVSCSHEKAKTGKTKDPVCGMTAEEKNAAGTSDK